ncbi:MAG: hypothetical protein IIV28_04755, partial [Alistipes sp.]|nr:hypothetical protein [Alistipes sp.]
MFETIGTVIEVDEAHFGIFTVLAGSAPAFHYLYMDQHNADKEPSNARHGVRTKDVGPLCRCVGVFRPAPVPSFSGADFSYKRPNTAKTARKSIFFFTFACSIWLILPFTL